MAKYSLSEGDLVTKQPDAVGIFSLSSGNMGKGLDSGSEVNGNYTESEVDAGRGFKLRTGSLKSASRVSFADENMDGNLNKVCSDTEINREVECISDDVTKTAYLLERSISLSAIERTKWDSFGSYSAFMIPEPVDGVIPEHECVTSENSEQNSSQFESDFEIDGIKVRNLDAEASSLTCTPVKGKPPLPNGKSKNRPSSAKQSWLLRLFESKMFDMSIAISYLFNSKEPGVQTYLGEFIVVDYAPGLQNHILHTYRGGQGKCGRFLPLHFPCSG